MPWTRSYPQVFCFPYGKVSVYGIYFDTDKATIKPESKAALDEIAKLLHNRADLKLFVVGHTDMTGSFAHNRSLSEARARAVVEALVKDSASRQSGSKGTGSDVWVRSLGASD